LLLLLEPVEIANPSSETPMRESTLLVLLSPEPKNPISHFLFLNQSQSANAPSATSASGSHFVPLFPPTVNGEAFCNPCVADSLTLLLMSYPPLAILFSFEEPHHGHDHHADDGERHPFGRRVAKVHVSGCGF
jgi:hypothetical protein